MVKLIFKNNLICRQGRARELTLKERCATSPGPASGSEVRLHRQGAAAGAGPADPLCTMDHSYRETVCGGGPGQFG